MSGLSASSAAAVLIVLSAASAYAEDTPGRFSMSPTEGGFVRLDRETGDMAFCKRAADGGWACEAMADSQQAMRREMDRLRDENEALRQGGRSASRNPPSGEPDLEPPPGESKIPIPTEQDVDKLFDYVEGMAKKLKERFKRLEEQNSDKGTPL